MSSTTPFLGLTLYNSSTDQAVAFATFRAVWGGPATSSNFYKIDTGLFNLDARIDILESYRGAIPVSAVYISANYYEASGVTAITAYTSGMTIILSLDTTSSGTVTLNINALGTKSVMKIDSTGAAINLTGSDLVKNRRALFVYDGTRWLWVSANSADQISIVGTPGNIVTVGTDNTLLGTTTLTQLYALLMPVGFVITLGVSTNPATLYGFGTWTAIAGRVIVGIDATQAEFDTLDETGGSKTHTLVTGEMPAHTHSLAVETAANAGGDVGNRTWPSGSTATSSAGGGGAHNNLQPYIVKYVWQRTA